MPLVLGDRIQLQQVILNLMLNAIEAMSEVSHPTREISVLSVKDGPNGALVTVQDSGVGLDRAALDQIFGAFTYQASRHGNRARGQPNDHPGPQAGGCGLAQRASGGYIPVQAAG